MTPFSSTWKRRKERCRFFFYHLGRMKVIADILVFGIFFKGVFPFDCIEILLLGLKHTVQIDQALFLLFQFHFLHQPMPARRVSNALG